MASNEVKGWGEAAFPEAFVSNHWFGVHHGSFNYGLPSKKLA
jgi:hypothetical protein